MKPLRIRGKPAGYPLICAPLVGAEREALLSEAAAALRARADIVEWRVDFFRQIGDAQVVLDTGRKLRHALGETPLLFTRRSVAEGGQPVSASEDQVVDVYSAVCAERLTDLVDYELAAQFRRAQELGGDVGKVSVMARGPEDALMLLAATLQASRELELPLIGVSMGPHGALTRVVGFAFGSALTFGVATASSAPGQMPIGELRAAIELLRR